MRRLVTRECSVGGSDGPVVLDQYVYLQYSRKVGNFN